MGQLSEDQYRFVAQEVYKNERENQKTAMQLQGDYGKWLLNTLLILNGGAVIGLAQSSAFGKSALHEAGMWFVGGIVSALACGFVAWVNWSLLAHYYKDWADPHMTFDVERWPRSTWRQSLYITLTYWLAIVAGFGSVGCLVVGAYVARTAMMAP